MSENKFYTLIPFIVFVGVFLGSGIWLNDFYALPAPIVITFSIVVAFLLFYKTSFNRNINSLISGCGDNKIITMCLIYLLAGAFSTVTTAIGGVDTVVNVGLAYIPVEYLAVGIFVISCFLSMAIGTSVGTIVALGPIVIALAEKTNTSMGIIAGALLGGAMFGDNLSVISDTTITATQTMRCNMKDKFRANFKLALPAAILTIVALLLMQNINDVGALELEANNNYWLTIPYIITIVLALTGVQVFTSLFMGIISAGIIGLLQADFDVFGFGSKMYEGFTSMTEIFILSMLTGGLAKMIEDQGGIQWILNSMQKYIKTSQAAVFGIATLVSSIGVCMANNTVAILVAGNLANDVATEYRLNRPYVASVLDIFACIIQGVLPYGAQVLILLSFANGKLSYIELVQHSYYFVFLFFITLFFMLFFRKERALQ